MPKDDVVSGSPSVTSPAPAAVTAAASSAADAKADSERKFASAVAEEGKINRENDRLQGVIDKNNKRLEELVKVKQEHRSRM